MKTNPAHHIKYRPDIDGLRALAVLLVVFYHAGFDKIVSGGFIGVDIFFVISGYLITKIIIKDLEKGNFSIISFYERRVRRILPALYFIVGICSIVSYFLFLPNEFDDFGQSIIATSLFVSNMFFWHETGYFNSAADLKPLLHTWSLSVEEQFYIFFPLLLMLLYKILKNFKLQILFICLFASFALSVWATTHAITANFYFAPTRAWELLIGSILAVIAAPKLYSWALEIISFTGLGLIIYSGFNFSYATPFPGASALLPCIGSAFIIYSSQGYKTIVSRFLSLKPFVFIGLISYSLYLWHWPIILFVKYLSSSTPGIMLMVLCILVSLIFSYLSWKYIETPFRHKKMIKKRKHIFFLAFAFSFLFIIMGGIFTLTSGVPQRFSNIEELKLLKQKNFDSACIDIPAHEFNDKKCSFGNPSNKKFTYIIWGDSHARAMTPAITAAAKREGNFFGFLSSNSGCLPLIGAELRHPKDNDVCIKINEETLKTIQPDMIVFLIARWGYYTNRSSINKEGPVWIKDEFSLERSEQENYKVLERSLNKTIKLLKEKGAFVVLVHSVPEFSKNVPDNYWHFGKNVTVSTKDYNLRMKRLNLIMSDVKEAHNITFINPSDVFCDDLVCHSIEGDKILFRDNDHISTAGAEKISPLYDPVFKQLNK